MSQHALFDIVQYTPDDRAACLRVFDSNLPDFFSPSERVIFAPFLEALPEPFWVARTQPEDAVAGCCGVSLADAGRTAWLRWGMIDVGHHRQGGGRQLLTARLDWIKTQPAVETVRVATTAGPSGFFLRMGFDLTGVIQDKYGQGIDRYDLVLTVRPTPS